MLGIPGCTADKSATLVQHMQAYHITAEITVTLTEFRQESQNPAAG